jgi:serine/threonine-protein kinase SRPK3
VQGDLKHIRHLKSWGLQEVLQEKYKMTEGDAESVASFLLPMLEFTPQRRASAKKCLEHPWFDVYRGGSAVGADDDDEGGGGTRETGSGEKTGSGDKEAQEKGGQEGAVQEQEQVGPPEV